MIRFLLVFLLTQAVAVHLAWAAGNPIIAFDDFSGLSDESIVGREVKEGGAKWMSVKRQKDSLVLDGEGHLVMRPGSLPEGRNFTWLEAPATGDEYYVAAKVVSVGDGQVAIGFTGEEENVLPLSASALLIINPNGKGFIRVKDEDAQGVTLAGSQPGEPGLASILYNSKTGDLSFFWNDTEIYQTNKPGLPAARPFLVFLVDESNPTVAEGLYFDSFLVAGGKTSMPSGD